MTFRSVVSIGLTIVSAVGIGVFAAAVYASSCPPPGYSGCHCENAACGVGQDNPCLSGWCLFNADCFDSSETTDGWWSQLETAPTCLTTEPLEGSGCEASMVQDACRTKKFCDCDFNFACDIERHEDVQFYYPCLSYDDE